MGSTLIMKKKSIIKWLESWLIDNTSKEQKNFTMETLDNPGWTFKINLEDSHLRNFSFDMFHEEINQNDWIYCIVEDNKFKAACGPLNLIKTLNIFRNWVEKNPQHLDDLDHLFSWMQKWYYQYCDEDWEHDERVRINNIFLHHWSITINLEGTHCENVPFEGIFEEETTKNWYHCLIRDGKFEGTGGPSNLIDILSTFKEWAEECQKKYIISDK